jgi:hypothetical protein
VNTHPQFNLKLRRSTVIAIVVAALAAAAVTGTVLAAGSPTDQKQAALDQLQAAQATREAGPRASKPSAVPNLPSSCPQQVEPGIATVVETPFHADATFTNGAEVVSSAGDPSRIFAGALQSDPQQGVLIVLREDRDPCKVRNGQASSHDGLFTYPSPSRGGALTLTQITGDTVAFSVADGSSGSFNYVAGQYMGG